MDLLRVRVFNRGYLLLLLLLLLCNKGETDVYSILCMHACSLADMSLHSDPLLAFMFSWYLVVSSPAQLILQTHLRINLA